MATYTVDFLLDSTQNTYKQLFSLNEQHVYGSSRLGVLNVNKLLYETEIHVTAVGGDGELMEYSYENDQITYAGVFKTTTRGAKTYELTNHLGIVMSTISDRKILVGSTITHFLPDVDTYQDYFPFGMVMSERSGSESSAGYRYGFNGMEYENELYQPGNAYDFGARVYDGRIGRWFSVDPLAAKYPDLSSYSFVANSPFIFFDKNGEEIYIVWSTGKDEFGYLEHNTDGFRYTPGMEVPDNLDLTEDQREYVEKTIMNLDRIYYSGNFTMEMDELINNSDYNVDVKQFDGRTHAAFTNGSRRDLYFNPDYGLIGEGIDQGLLFPPDAALLHELGHFSNELRDKDGFDQRREEKWEEKSVPMYLWSNREEYYNITVNEHKYARDMGYIIRTSHRQSSSETESFNFQEDSQNAANNCSGVSEGCDNN